MEKIVIELRLKQALKIPVTAECVKPDSFVGLSPTEIENLQVWEGNKRKRLRDLFEISGSPSETLGDVHIKVSGDIAKMKKIGASMSGGKVSIEGNVGVHLGEEMRGGTIVVNGNAGSWLGSMMKDGKIEVRGDSEDYVGSSYRGSPHGMSGGKIVVHGNVGNEVGVHMRKGTIKVFGNAGQFTGLRMKGGTIYVQGDSEGRVGACMKGGKIVVNGRVKIVLPSFTIDSVKAKVKVDDEGIEGPFYLFRGDLTEKGEGRLYILKARNQHLNFYEHYLK